MSDFSAAQGWLRAHQRELLETLMAWVNINSGSYHVAGLRQQAKAILPLYDSWVDDISSQELPYFTELNDRGEPQDIPTGPLISIKKQQNTGKRILLSGHIDTVFAPDNPFQQATLEGNRLRGPGVADMKGGLLVMYAALRALHETDAKEKLDWEIILNPDEEIGSFSSRDKLIEAAKDKDFALVFEPALDEQGTLVSARKGSMKITLIVHGKAAHAGRDFEKGANAIVAIAEIAQKLHKLNNQREGFILNVGKIIGGTTVNIVPDRAMIWINIRYGNKDDLNWFNEEVNRIIQPWQGGMYDVITHQQKSREPKPFINGNAKLLEQVIKTGKSLELNIGHKPSGGVSDGNVFWQAGLANVDTMGVCGGHLHSNEEYMLVDSLIQRAELTAKLLYDYAHDTWKI